MYTAQEIAKWFLYKNYAEQKEKVASNDNYEVYEGITHLKLQKLLYNAQGVYLATKGKKLFIDDCFDWLISDKNEGMSCQMCYNSVKSFSTNISPLSITRTLSSNINSGEYDLNSEDNASTTLSIALKINLSSSFIVLIFCFSS